MEQKELTELLAKASEAYYNSGNAIMSDLEFDRKVEELRQMEKESGVVLPGSPTQKVGTPEKVDGLKKVTHEYPALSLDKVKYKDRKDLVKWLGNKEATVSWKMDGLTVVLTYDGGKLTQAVTRGDGIEGSDVTHNAVYFEGVPKQIAYSGHLVVRGEAVMEYKEFERVNAEAGGIYENPRNLAAATVQMLDANESKKRKINFYAFELVAPEPKAEILSVTLQGAVKPYTSSNNISMFKERMNLLGTLGFQTVPIEMFVTADNILEVIDRWEEQLHKGLPFPTDGLVITYDDVLYGWGLGSTGHHPRWAMALKWSDETAKTIIRDVEWSVGRTGFVTPVAIFDSIKLGAGSTITRASLHNLSEMKSVPAVGSEFEKEPIRIGSEVEVYLANMIIPQIATVRNTWDGGLTCPTRQVQIPTKCPVCGQELRREKTGGVSMQEAYTRARAYLESAAKSKYFDIYASDKDPIVRLWEYPDEASKVKEINRTETMTVSVTRFYVPPIETLHCDNTGCPARQIGNLMNTFSKDGLFVKGLGESQIQDLIDYGVVDSTPLSFYKATTAFSNGKEFSDKVVKLLEKDRWGKKKWINLVDAINASRNTTLQKFLYSLNIPLLGNDLSKKLAKFWHYNLECFRVFIVGTTEVAGELTAYGYDRAMDTLTSIDGVGEEKARNIVEWARNLMSDNAAYDAFDALCKELHFAEPAPADNNTSLAGLTFVITGAVHVYKNRDEFKASVEARGGKVAGSVSKNTDYLVNNDNTSGKSQKAKELGIPIISEDEFISRFGK